MDDGSRNTAPAPTIDEATLGQTQADAVKAEFFENSIADIQQELATETDPEIRQAIQNGLESILSAREKHRAKMAAKVTAIVSGVQEFTPQAVIESQPTDAAKSSES